MTDLWHGYPIRVIGITGEMYDGKTLWMLMAHPNWRALDKPSKVKVYDSEGSSESYVSMFNFTRVDLNTLAESSYGQSFKPPEYTKAFVEDLKATPKGEYDIIGLDTIQQIEEGIEETV
ncbi:hypothetical protein LCGC14_2520020, partial [marine sediment metagenome]